jgi:hypothetical protein
MPGVLKERLQLQLGTADTQTRDHMQNFHNPPFLTPETASRPTVREVGASTPCGLLVMARQTST